MSKPHIIDVTLYHLATQEHKKEFEKLQQRIKELEAEKEQLRLLVIQWKNKAISYKYDLDNLKSENTKLIEG